MKRFGEPRPAKSGPGNAPESGPLMPVSDIAVIIPKSLRTIYPKAANEVNALL